MEIEQTVKQTQSDMKEFIHQSKTSSPARIADLESFKSESSMVSDDSRRLLEDNVIRSQLTLTEPDHDIDLSALASLRQSSPIGKMMMIQNDMMEGFKEIEDSPKIYTGGARPKTREVSPTLIDQPELGTSSQSNGLFQFLPQLSKSVFGSPQEEASEELLIQPSAPIEDQPRPRSTEEDDQFSELVDWAKGSIVSGQDGIVLTDDGRTMTEDEAKPKCPICSELFEVGEVKALEIHVDSHLATNLYCPICNISFEVDKREAFQAHVQVCFNIHVLFIAKYL